MIEITCKCGKTTMTFNNMSAKDFPDGWETECCKESHNCKDNYKPDECNCKDNCKPEEEKQETTKKTDEQSSVLDAPIKKETTKKAPKRRGRKKKNA